ncbi:hypothetical protein Tco_0940800 [Tanacetum coccineum]|uniref:CCHC-type domain-containing protein n=1 Tax=Tanacetum coccineum TaxID=301880 RepID=A0ABQ5DP03_9ASTR
MASFDYRLNPLYAIRECSSCGALYNKSCGCSKGGLIDKFVRDPNKTPDSSQRPPIVCVKCGNPVEGPSCQGFGSMVEEIKEVWDITGKNSSQSPPQINHNCCYECGDSLDVIFCQRYTCKSCGKGAHIGYNCPPKAPIISNPEPCNQTIDELPQTLPKFDHECYLEKENSLPYVSKPNFVDDSPNVFNPPPHPERFSLRLRLSTSSPVYCGGPHETFQCQSMNEDYYHEQNSCYDSNSFGFDQFQPLQYTVNHPISNVQNSLFNAQNEFLNSQNKLMEQMTSMCDMIPVCYDDDDDDDEESSIPLKDTIIFGLPPCVAITSALSTEKPVDSLIMEDEHLDTIPETESNEFIKSSVENLFPTPSELEDFSDIESECDVLVYDNLTNFSNPLFDANDDDASSDEEEFKISSNPLFDLDEVSPIDDEVLESITSIPPGIDSFDAESDLIVFALGDTSFDSSSKIDFLLDEFAGELTRLQSIPPGIDNINLDPEGDILFLESLLYDNSSPRPPEEFNSENPTESFSPSPIPVEDSDSLMEGLTFFLDDSTIDVVEDIPVDVPNILPTHPALQLDFDFISSNDLGSDLDVSSPSGDSNKISTGDLHEDFPDCDDSRARGYVLHSLELHILSFILGIQYPNLFD